MTRLVRWLWVPAAVAAPYLVNVLFSGMIIALTAWLKFWAYPAVFAINVAIAALVFRTTSGQRERIRAWIDGKTARFAKRLEKGVWKKLWSCGAFALIFVAVMLSGAIAGAIAAHVLGLAERRAWIYVIVSTLCMVALWVTVYLRALHLL